MEDKKQQNIVSKIEQRSEPSNMSKPEESNLSQKGARRNNKSTGKRIFVLLLLAGLGYLVYSVVSLYVSPDRNIRQIYLIPKDAAVIIQTNDPINDWKKFSQSDPWNCLKQAESFADIAKSVNTLDSIIKGNNFLLSLTGKREMIISLHKTKGKNWGFLIVVDLQKVSKMGVLKDNIEQVFKMADFSVTNRNYNGINITECLDRQTRDVLYTAFIDNHFVASYTPTLVHAAIDERNQPVIGLDQAFVEVEKGVANKGLARVYLNYAYFPQYLAIYLGDNEYVNMFCGSMDYAGLYLLSDKSKMEVTGSMNIKDDPDPYVSALLNSGSQKMKAHEIMSSRTALYANLGFSDPVTFVNELEKALAEKDQLSYDSYKSTRSKLEKYFGISMDKNFLGWMSGEFAIAQAEHGLLGTEPELILAIRTKDIKDARTNMSFIETRVKKRSPVGVKKIDYKGYEVNYVEMKGFFKLFFGSLFEKFEKPYYTYVDDYVVFSNKASSLLSFIEDHEQKLLLKNEAGFKRATAQTNSTSTIFVYIDMPKYYDQLRPMMSPAMWSDLQKNRDVLLSFPQWTFQVIGDKNTSMQVVMNYKEAEEPTVVFEEIVEEKIDADTSAEIHQSERELMNELKRFYVENFEGNILREYYPDGALKSESEVRGGKRHGRYREFYENGAMIVRGKYSKGEPRGVWKYYTENGKFDRKERF